jgi:hypothetical protein
VRYQKETYREYGPTDPEWARTDSQYVHTDAEYARTKSVDVIILEKQETKIVGLENKLRKKSNPISTTILTDARVTFR